jgi:hypothetical protein
MRGRGFATRMTVATLLATALALARPTLAAPLPKTNGFYTAQVGAQCLVEPSAIGAQFLGDYDLAKQMALAHDHAALLKMVEAKRLWFLTPGLTIFVTERLGERIHVRPKGEMVELWMHVGQVDCGTTSAETTEIAKPTKPTKTTRGAR